MHMSWRSGFGATSYPMIKPLDFSVRQIGRGNSFSGAGGS
jgi:hypothetical protein